VCVCVCVCGGGGIIEKNATRFTNRSHNIVRYTAAERVYIRLYLRVIRLAALVVSPDGGHAQQQK